MPTVTESFAAVRAALTAAEDTAREAVADRDARIAELERLLAEGAEPPKLTVFGVNGERTGKNGVTRTPDSRRYWGPGKMPTTFTSLGGPVEQELTMSWKLSPAEVIAGKHDARIVSLHRDAKAKLPKLVPGRRHRTVPWHEPASEILGGQFTGAQHRDHVIHVAKLLDREGLLDVFQVCPNYTMGPPKSGADFDTTWLPDADQVPPGSVLISGDLYGNPYGGLGLEAQYDDPKSDLDVLVAAVRAHGYDEAAVLEVNAPRRSHDADGQKRLAYLSRFVDLVKTGYPGIHFVVVDVWEGVGKWDQRFTLPAEWQWLAALLASSPRTVRAA